MTTQQAPGAKQIQAGWDRIANGFDEFVTPQSTSVAQEALEHLGPAPGRRLLDVAAGSGALSILAAQRGMEVLATDLAPRMIDRLTDRARAAGLDGIEARVMDGTALDVDDDSFDAAASVNGVSLFPDIARGLAEMVRVTRRGGVVLVAAMAAPQRVEFIGFFLAAMKATVPGFTGLPTDPPPLPFQVADPEVLAGRLRAAGLTGVQVHPASWEMRIDSGEHLWNVFTSSNPLGAGLVAGLDAEQRREVTEVLDGMLGARSGGAGGAVLHADVNVGVGTA